MATKYPKGIIDCGPSPNGPYYRIPNATMRTTGKVNCFFVNVPWSLLQTANNGAIASNNIIDQALVDLRAINVAEPGVNLTMALRVFCGAYAPTWAKNLSSGPVDIWDSFDGKHNTMGKYWVPATNTLSGGLWTTLQDGYKDLQTKLAALYDNVPEIVGQTVSMCALFYPEQFLNSASQRNDVVGEEGPFTINTTSTGAQMVAKGFTNAAGRTAIQASWGMHSAWTQTCTIVAFNPASLVSDSGGTAATDEAFTETCIDSFVTAFPNSACLSNYSLRKFNNIIGGPSPQASYTAMYNKMISKNVAIVYQTARKARLCEYGTVNADPTGACWTLIYDWATTIGQGLVTGIETIAEYQADYNPATVAAYDAVIDVPLTTPVRTVIALPQKSGKLFRWWEPRWATGTADLHNQAEVEQMGTECEIAVVHYQQLHNSTAATRSQRVQQMHDAAKVANHECTVSVYVNGTFASTGKTPASGAYPDEAYMKSTSLTHPFLADSGKTWLMNPRSRYWADASPTVNRSVPDEANDRRVAKFTSPPADGILIDNLGWGVVTSGYNAQIKGDGTWGAAGSDVASFALATKEAPLNTKTGGRYDTGVDRAAWTTLTKYLASQTYAKYGHQDDDQTIGLYVNGGSQGNRYFDTSGPTYTLADVAQLVMFENWVRDANDPLDPTQTTPTGSQKTQANWVKDMNCVVDLENKGRGALLYVKVWDGAHTHVTGAVSSNGTVFYQSSNDDNDLAGLKQTHKVVDASYMLVTCGHSFMHFRHDASGGNERINQCRWYANINAMGWYTQRVTKAVATDGTGGIDDTVANGGLKQADGTFRRLFDNGVVIVNSDVTTKTVTLPAVPAGKTSWKDVDDTAYTSGQAGISMLRNTALILRAV